LRERGSSGIALVSKSLSHPYAIPRFAIAGALMKVAELLTTSAPLGERVRDTELDCFGLTHPGKVRTENQDHFFVGTIHPEVLVHGTSLDDVGSMPLRGERIAALYLVADGVTGAGEGGRDASRVAAETIARYVSSTLRSYHAAGTENESTLLQSLTEAALQAHHAVRMEASTHPEARGMATTLTLGLTVWPWLYVVQLGDSRCYYCWKGELHQITRDQTIGQDLVDQGLLARERLPSSPFKDVLSSAAGADEAVPEVSRLRIDRQGSVLVFCTDGLTKHVSDAEIAAAIKEHPRSKDVCESLLALALERGGTDNVTIVVARRRRREASPA
jgi:serine/threonine protein phosphatase PrpC